MDIYGIRRKRLFQLLEAQFGGRQVDLARTLSRTPAYISNCLSTGKNNKPIGEKFARYVEERLGLARGWLDQFEGTAMPFLSPQAIEFALRFESLTAEQRAALEALMQAFNLRLQATTDPVAPPPPAKKH